MLQRDKAALGMTYERVTQRGRRAEKSQDIRLAPKPAVCKEQPEFPACGLVANRGTLEKDEAGRHGPLELASDSDDSVDRDIEEAIQEYLKAKGGASEPMSQGVLSVPEPAHSSALPIPCPSQLTPSSGSVPVGASEDQDSTSPASVSSEDSFEQSIRVEIEQFLHEKRQREHPKCSGSVDKKSDPNESPARLRGNRETSARAALIGTDKEFIFRKPPGLTKVSTQSRNSQPKLTTEPETPVSTKLAAHRPEAAQSRGGTKRGVPARRSKRIRSSAPVHQASDSSSDDGIEEAIHLYQLEKTRKEDSGDQPLRAQSKEESPGSTQPSALPEAQGGEAEVKDRPVPSRTVGLSDIHLSKGHGPLGKASEKESSEDKNSSQDSDKDSDMAIKDLLRSKRKFKKRCRDPRASCKKVSFGSTQTRCGYWEDRKQQALRSCLPKCRGDNKDSPGAEDANPTFLPRRKSPEGGPPSKDTEASSHPPSASSPTSEDSSVDSDDSIELEIRRFLAEKAKESVHNTEPQGGPAKLEMPCRKKPTLGLQRGVRTQRQKTRGTPQLSEGRRGPERTKTPATSLLSQTGKGTLRAEQATALGQCKNTRGKDSAKASPLSRKSANVHKDHGL